MSLNSNITNQRKLELLAPAKNLEVGKAALMAGADAVYIGGPSFGARAAAGNSLEDIKELCAFAHRFGAHVYMTTNTLLYDNELVEVEKLIGEARLIGVDAIIVQDPAILSMPTLKDMEIHASTQMNIDTVEKLAFARKLGFAQVVVPREFSLDEIKAFSSAFPDTRLEVFVSGAMCVSVSGICYISELMTDRSANRGECAQICRLPMELYHLDPKLVRAAQKAATNDLTASGIEFPEPELLASGHLLSMKDNLRLHELEDLVEAGAWSFKIEGRLKDRDYVVNQVAAFRERLDAVIEKSNGKYVRASLGVTTRAFIPDVTKTFNRGFTSALVHGDNAHMINTKTPKNLGELMGKIKFAGFENSASQNRSDKASPSFNKGGFKERQGNGFNRGNERNRGFNKDNGKGRFNAGQNGGNSNNPAKGSANNRSYVVDFVLEHDCILSNGDSFTFFDINGELSGFRANRASILSAPKTQANNKNSSSKNHQGSNFNNKNGAGKSNGKDEAASNGSHTVEGALAQGAIKIAKGSTVRLHLPKEAEGIKEGSELYRNVDSLFIKAINMPKALIRKVPLSCELSTKNEEITVRFFDEYGRSGSCTLTHDMVHEQIAKAQSDALQNGEANKALDVTPSSALPVLKEEVMLSKITKLGDDNLSLDPKDVRVVSDGTQALGTLSAFNNARRLALQDYLRTITLPRCECKDEQLQYLDGKSEHYVRENRIVKAEDLQSSPSGLDPKDHEALDLAMAALTEVDPRLIMNERSRAFYEQYLKQGLPAPNRLIGNAVMTCRNCLIKNHAVCHEEGGSTTGFFLQIGKHRFDIVTNCKRCLMYLVPHEE